MDVSGVLYSSMACKRLLVDPLTRNSFGWIAAGDLRFLNFQSFRGFFFT